jgi:glycosyltransferase involved in cell wall biosynthesis
MDNENTYKNGHDTIRSLAHNGHSSSRQNGATLIESGISLPEILFITSYPPRECGIATYSQDLIRALNDKFKSSFKISICALESETETHNYADVSPDGQEIKYILNTDHHNAFGKLAESINNNEEIRMVVIQHEFGFFNNKEDDFRKLMELLTKPVVLVFHTILPQPDKTFKGKVLKMINAAEAIVVMTQSSQKILVTDYGVAKEKITVIPHGTHLVPHSDKEQLKNKYGLSGKKVLSTFGLLNAGKNIETTLKALPAVIKQYPDVVFLIIGKTHPSVVKREGYKYRNMLDALIVDLDLQNHIQYLNYYLPLPELLEYLQLTDIYLFTSKDPNQAVSGTFSYALSCGCPIISTPIPHAREVLRDDAGIIVDFENPGQLTDAILSLLNDEQRRINISLNGLHRMASTAWENAAIAHARLFEQIGDGTISLDYTLPPINLAHLKKMTTDFGIIQFSKINQPDISSGYTLDDNARALIAMCQYFELTKDKTALKYIRLYFSFIKYCMQPEGYFLNYVDKDRHFTEQNQTTNLADANGRAIWALGHLIFMDTVLPQDLIRDAELTLHIALLNVNKIYSTRAMSFIIKGLYYRNANSHTPSDTSLLKHLADRLVHMYRHESSAEWCWFENYLTYANSTLPEALLCAWLATGDPIYKEIARSSFDFLLSKTFFDKKIKVICNKNWLHKGKEALADGPGGEQPIDVAYTILALKKFYEAFKEEEYLDKMKIAFSWFLGNNHLNQIIYNPLTGGCYDGLEDHYVNLNQGAESTVSYLMARLTLEKYRGNTPKTIRKIEHRAKFIRNPQPV